MTTINLATYCVRLDDGSIDAEGTVTKFADDLLKYQTECETESATILAAANRVIDTHPDTNFNMPSLASYTCQEMNVQPAVFIPMKAKVEQIFRDNSSSNREDGALFRIAKGKGGGIKRWADVPLEEKKSSKK